MRKLKNYWEFSGRYLWSDFKIGIKNIIYWLPIIWRDRDWDSDSTLRLIQWKLKSQSKYFRNRGRYINSESDARLMSICVELINKISDDYYGSEWSDYIESEFHFIPIDDGRGLSEMKSETLSENFDDYFTKYPLIYKRAKAGEGPFNISGETGTELKKVIAMNMSHINSERAWKLFIKIIDKHSRGWWN